VCCDTCSTLVRPLISPRTSARFTATAFLFQRKGIIQVVLPNDRLFDDLWEAAVEGGAEDVSQVEGSEEVEVGRINLP
jgi:transcriptional/translational regulatory protein YebC/TACO1